MNDVYTYAYLDPRVSDNSLAEYGITKMPIYIGIGRGTRMFDHLWCAQKGRYKQSYRINKICKMLSEGCEPTIVKLKEGLTPDEAKLLEIELIAKIGTAKVVEGVKRGPLTNLTRGGDGMVGFVHTERHRYNHSKHNLGKVGMMKGSLRIMVEPNEIDSYIIGGWVLGFGDKVRSMGTANSRWMTNGVQRKVVKDQQEIDDLLQDGWKFGSALDGQKNTSSGKVAVCKDEKFCLVDKTALQSFLNDGWILKHMLDGRKKIYKDDQQKIVKVNEIDAYILDGWVTEKPKLTLTCRCCKKEFQVSLKHRNKVYCSRTCWYNRNKSSVC